MSATEQYVVQQAQINQAALQLLQQFLSSYLMQSLTLAKWIALLQFVFPKMLQWRLDASDLARAFFDSEFAQVYPGQPRHDVLRDHYEFPWLVEALEPARKAFSRPDATQTDLDYVLRIAMKEIENAGRATIVEAVQTLNQEIVEGSRDLSSGFMFVPSTAQDTVADAFRRNIAETAGRPALSSKKVVGWARIATGRETCAFCLTMVSRGPVYRSAEGAGLQLSDEDALVAVQGNDPEIDQLMAKWHENCDCKVVPVFNAETWDGRAAWKRAEEIWNSAQAPTDTFRENNPGRKHVTGSKKGRNFTYNEDVILYLRRQMTAGAITGAEFAL